MHSTLKHADQGDLAPPIDRRGLGGPATVAGGRRTMTAVTQHAYGGPEQFDIERIEVPTPGKGEVLVEVEAAGVDRGTWHLMAGLPYVVRLGFGLRRPKNPVPGLDLAGTVVAVGADTERLRVGDRVFGYGKGSLAGFTVADEHKVSILPEGVGFASAATTAVSGSAALHALDTAEVGEGDRVLVLGASGGVGSFATQLAAARGAVVTGVSSRAKTDLVRALGAAETLAYDEGPLDLAAEAPEGGFDVILDTGGLRPLRELRRALRADGTLVVIGGEGGNDLTGGFERSVGAALRSPFVSQNLKMLLTPEHHRLLDRLAAAVADGSIGSAVGATYPLERTADAMTDLVAGRVAGKVAVIVGAAAALEVPIAEVR